MANYGDVLRHHLAHLAPDGERILGTLMLVQQRVVNVLLPHALSSQTRSPAVLSRPAASPRAYFTDAGPASIPHKCTKRANSLPAGLRRDTDIRIPPPHKFPERSSPGSRYPPKAAHRVVHRRENFHRLFARVHAHELLVNLQNAFEFLVQRLARECATRRDTPPSRPPRPIFISKHDLVDRARRYVTRHQVAVLRIPLLEEVEALVLRNIISGRLSPASSAPTRVHPRRAPIRSSGAFVLAGNRRGMHLDEFAIRVVRALLEKRRLRGASAHHRVRRAPENRAVPARAENQSVRGKRLDLHGLQIHRANAARHAAIVNHCRKKRPAFELLNLSFGFKAPHLLVQRIEKLLPRRRSRKSRALIKRSAKPPEIQQCLLACG